MRNFNLHIANLFALAALCGCADGYVPGEVLSGMASSNVAEPIRVSVKASQVETRGAGAVGGVGESNVWEGQRIYINMYERGKLKPTKDDYGSVIYQDAPFYAPGGDNRFSLETRVPGSEPNRADATDHKIQYYPQSTPSDFWGYHIDNAHILRRRADGETVADDAEPVTVVTASQLTGEGTAFVPFRIDGSQDLMVAKAEPTLEEVETIGGATRFYSNYTARRGVQPQMEFQHLLTQFIFRAGANSDKVLKGYMDDDTTVPAGEKVKSDYAVTIDSISLWSKTTGNLIVAYNTSTIPERIDWERATQGAERGKPASLYMQRKRNLGTEEAPNWQMTDKLMFPLKQRSYTEIGGSLLVPGGETVYEGRIHLSQYVPYNEAGMKEYDQDGNLVDIPQEFRRRYFSYPFRLLASSVMQGDGSSDEHSGDTPSPQNTFEAGKAYYINILVYSLERIIINTSLTPWGDGGNVDGGDLN